MARPRNEKLKQEIRFARATGMSIADLRATFGLSRNTLFYHLREDENVDGRAVYTKEDKTRIASMTPDELKDEAQRLGKTVQALQRAAYRARKAADGKAEVDARARISLRGFLDFNLESELLLFGLSGGMLRLANRRLLVYKVRLEAPNKLVAPDGRYCLLTLAFQRAILTDTAKTITENAAKIKGAWRQPTCPACKATSMGLVETAEGKKVRVCSCGWRSDTGKVETIEELWRQGYHSEEGS